MQCADTHQARACRTADSLSKESGVTRWTDHMPPIAAPYILGWEEWVSLPELGLPAVKAKVDTGARTSALHAHFVEAVRVKGVAMVRFGVHPIPRRGDVEVVCMARVIDQREVTSSNGERENRYVIETPIRIGERVWPIEITLTNRDAMAYRMLLGRQAIAEDILVDPASSFRQPRLRYKLYNEVARR
jgi:ribosomal protein S6--L-glutamate ligase